jgi:hypothetical protein
MRGRRSEALSLFNDARLSYIQYRTQLVVDFAIGVLSAHRSHGLSVQFNAQVWLPTICSLPPAVCLPTDRSHAHRRQKLFLCPLAKARPRRVFFCARLGIETVVFGYKHVEQVLGKLFAGTVAY